MSTVIASILAKIGLEDSEFKRNAATLGGAVDTLIDTISNIHPAAAIALAGIAALGKFMAESAALADESNRIQANLAASIKSTGGAAGLSVRDINAMNDALMEQTGIDDELLTQASAVLLTFRHISSDAFPRATQAAIDLSAKLGGDLQGSIVMVGKALDDPIAGVTALRRVGVQLSDEQEQQIKDFMDVNDLASAQAVIMQELETQVGGTASAIHEQGNRSEDAKNAIENLKEEIGQSMIPAQQAWNEAVQKAADGWMQLFKNMNLTNDIAAEQKRIMEEQGLILAGKHNETTRAAIAEGKLTIATKAQIDAAYEQARANIFGADAMGELTEETNLAAEAVDRMSDVSVIMNVQGAYEDITTAAEEYYKQLALVHELIQTGEKTWQKIDGQWVFTAVPENVLNDLKAAEGAYDKAREANEKWISQFLFSLVQTQLAEGGLTDAELAQLMTVGVALGTIDPQVAETTQAVMAAINGADPKALQESLDAMRELMGLEPLPGSGLDIMKNLKADLEAPTPEKAVQEVGDVSKDISEMAKSAVEELSKLDIKTLEKINTLWLSFVNAPDEVTKTIVWEQEGDPPPDIQGATSDTQPTMGGKVASADGKVWTIQNFGTINFPLGMLPRWVGNELTVQ